MAITNVLPDPTHSINTAGVAGPPGIAVAGYTNGVGYSSVKLSSMEPLTSFASKARRQEKDTAYHHRWKVDINYNPLTCEQFHLIYAFINYRQTNLIPFFVSVPPYSSQILAGILTGTNVLEGDSVMLIAGTGAQAGALFNIAGNTKAYQVSRVETETDYVGTSPGAGNERVHFTPSVVEDVSSSTNVIFTDPLIQVMLESPEFSYSLDKNGRFNFSLSLVEVLP